MLGAFTETLQDISIWGFIFLIIIINIVYCHGLTLQKIYWPERFCPNRLKTNKDLSLDSVVSFHHFTDLGQKKDIHIKVKPLWKRPSDFVDKFSFFFYAYLYWKKSFINMLHTDLYTKVILLAWKKGIKWKPVSIDDIKDKIVSRTE